jgi:hypothetical protein
MFGFELLTIKSDGNHLKKPAIKHLCCLAGWYFSRKFRILDSSWLIVHDSWRRAEGTWSDKKTFFKKLPNMPSTCCKWPFRVK